MLVGAVVTALLHVPAAQEHSLWLGGCFCCGCSGLPLGFLPAFLATRRDPWMGAGAGFAVAFLSTGLGVIAVAVVTVLRGFHISDAALAEMRRALEQQPDVKPDQVQAFLDSLLHVGPVLIVLVPALVALMGGLAGALVGAIAARRPYPPPPTG